MDRSSVNKNKIQLWPETNQLTKPLREVAKILNVHPNTVFRWKKSGQIEFVRLGKASIHFTYDQVIDYINKNKEQIIVRTEF